jgi:hypothetical protein
MANTRWRFVDCDADHIAAFQFSQIITVPTLFTTVKLYPQCDSGTANATDSKCAGCDATDQEFARWSHKPMMQKKPWTLAPEALFLQSCDADHIDIRRLAACLAGAALEDRGNVRLDCGACMPRDRI